MFDERIRTDPYNDENYYSPYYRGYWIKAAAKDSIKPVTPDNLYDYRGYPLLSASTIHSMPFGDCADYGALAVALLRSHSIAAVTDYLPQWGKGYMGHFWFGFLNDNGAFLCAPYGMDSNPGEIFYPYAQIPKIFRYTYSHNGRADRYLRTTSFNPANVSPFQQDVTDQYIATSDLKVPLTVRPDGRWVYIAAFDNSGWNIVDFGKRRGRSGHFQKMGRQMAYIVYGISDGDIIPVSDPFILESNGAVRYMRADTTVRRQVILTRKTFLKEHVARVESRLIGAKVQASDYEDFRTAETLYVIDSMIFPDQVPLKASKKYKYWRLLSADNSYGSISELQFFLEGEDAPVQGRIIGTPGNGYWWVIHNVFDGNWLTAYDGDKQADGNWYGLAFDKPVCVDRVRCVPRTDDNLIHHGDLYELRYWSPDGWKIIGQQVAREKYLVFDDVPDNAILWLRDLTQGKEERIFTYENGRQVWW